MTGNATKCAQQARSVSVTLFWMELDPKDVAFCKCDRELSTVPGCCKHILLIAGSNIIGMSKVETGLRCSVEEQG